LQEFEIRTKQDDKNDNDDNSNLSCFVPIQRIHQGYQEIL
jgi:hypothetical protein